jgi:hypothetical protein
MINRLGLSGIDALDVCRSRSDRSAPESFCVWNRS